jgi:hypothetical protein
MLAHSAVAEQESVVLAVDLRGFLGLDPELDHDLATAALIAVVRIPHAIVDVLIPHCADRPGVRGGGIRNWQGLAAPCDGQVRTSTETRDQDFQRRAQGLRYMAQLDHIEPALSRFVLRNERLRFLQPLGYGNLSQSSFTAEHAQQGTELLVLLRPDGLVHPASAPCTYGYPNLGYP